MSGEVCGCHVVGCSNTSQTLTKTKWVSQGGEHQAPELQVGFSRSTGTQGPGTASVADDPLPHPPPVPAKKAANQVTGRQGGEGHHTIW